MFLAEPEARHQHRLGFVLGADNADHLIEVEVGDAQTFQQVQAAFDLGEAVIETARHRIDTETQPFGEDALEILYLRPAIQADHVEIDAETLFQIRGGEQVLHHLVRIDAVRARHDHQADRVFVIGFIAQVFNHRQLLRTHLRGDLLKDLRRADLVRQRSDDDVAFFALIDGASADRTSARLIHRQQLVARGDDFRGGRVIGAAHVFAQVGDGGVRVVQ